MRLLDLFCGAGGASRGYADAGFEVVGVDIKRRARYPYEFHQADALEFMRALLYGGRVGSDQGYLTLDMFDAIHASPPCQHYSIATIGAGAHVRANHPALIAPIRKLLIASGKPYVIENVIGARAELRDPITVCGTMFPDLRAIDTDGQPLFLRRHRLFESSLPLEEGTCRCVELKKVGWWIGGVYGGGRSKRWEARYVRRGGYTPHVDKRRELMGIDWMSMQELNESIPPAYTRWIGTRLMEAL